MIFMCAKFHSNGGAVCVITIVPKCVKKEKWIYTEFLNNSEKLGCLLSMYPT